MSFAEQFSSYYDHIHRPSHLPELQATDSKDFENIVWLVYNGPALEFYAKESYIPLLDGVIVTTNRDRAFRDELRQALVAVIK